MHDIGWGWEFLMAIGMIAFWILVVLGVIWLVRGGASSSTLPSPPPAPTESAIDILDRRLASGELTLEEYQERRDAIEHSRDSGKASV